MSGFCTFLRQPLHRFKPRPRRLPPRIPTCAMATFSNIAMLPTTGRCKRFSGPTCPLQHLLQIAMLRLNQVLDAVLLLL